MGNIKWNRIKSFWVTFFYILRAYNEFALWGGLFYLHLTKNNPVVQFWDVDIKNEKKKKKDKLKLEKQRTKK